MKVAVITSGFLPIPATKGGAVENLIINLLNENEKESKNNVDFEIFSIYDNEAVEESKKYQKVKFRFIKPSNIIKILDKILFLFAKNILKKDNSQSYRFIFQRLYYLKQVSKFLKKYDYDRVLLENHPTQYLALKWNQNYKKYNGRYYYHCHNEFPGLYGCENIIKNTKKFICVSDYIAKYLKKYLNMEEKNFGVLRNGIDTEKFRKSISQQEISDLKKTYNINENDKIILFTGRIVPEKGIKELLISLKKIKQDNYKLIIVGTSLNSLNVKTKFEEELNVIVNDLKDKVIFTGFIDYDEIYKYYKMADFAVLPSIWDDPAPLTIIEALVSGLPIITTNSGGIPEYAKENSAIILDRNSDLIFNLTKNIEELLEDDEKRIKMGQNGRKVSENLTLNSFYDNFTKLLLENSTHRE